jgi:glycine cleavage system regulatory protein
MRTSLIVTVIGDDKPGIVEQLSEFVLGCGGNWEESRMAHLAGKFAGILRVSVDQARADELVKHLARLQSRGLRVIAEDSSGAARGAQTVGFDLVGSDRPGIVRDISRVLVRHGVNIEELETEVTSAAESGEPLFRARARLGLPASLDAPTLRTALESLANDLMVDITFDG